MSKIKKGILIGIGLVSIVKKEAKKVLSELEKEGKLNRPKAEKLAKNLVKKALVKERKIQGVVKRELVRDLKSFKNRVKKVVR